MIRHRYDPVLIYLPTSKSALMDCICSAAHQEELTKEKSIRSRFSARNAFAERRRASPQLRDSKRIASRTPSQNRPYQSLPRRCRIYLRRKRPSEQKETPQRNEKVGLKVDVDEKHKKKARSSINQLHPLTLPIPNFHQRRRKRKSLTHAESSLRTPQRLYTLRQIGLRTHQRPWARRFADRHAPCDAYCRRLRIAASHDLWFALAG